MRNVVQVNPAGVSYNVTDLERMRIAKIEETMKASSGDVYEAHVGIYERQFDAQEAAATIEPYWATIVGDFQKGDAVRHLQAVAQSRRALKKQMAALGVAPATPPTPPPGPKR